MSDGSRPAIALLWRELRRHVASAVILANLFPMLSACVEV